MQVVEPGSSANITIELSHDGIDLDAASVTYSLYDGNDVELIAATPVSDFTVGNTAVTITIDAQYHQPAVPSHYTDARQLVLDVVDTDGNLTKLRHVYVLAALPIAFMNRSYQSLALAQATAFDIPNLNAWSTATEVEQRGALIEAFNRIGRLRFNVDGTYYTDINEQTQAQMLELPSVFLDKLRRAQVIEADVILGGDSVAQKRLDGLLSETVGESSKMWRPGKPLTLPVSKRALSALAGYLSYGARVGRGS